MLAHLGRFGALTARDICARSHEEKTKVNRAVAGLGAEGLADPQPQRGRPPRRAAQLTEAGQAVFAELGQRALAYDAALRARLGPEANALEALLRRIATDLPRG